MKQLSCWVIGFLFFTGSCWADGFDHTPLSRVLGRFVSERGLVDYPALKADSGDLNAYIQQLKRVSPESHPEQFRGEADRLAYWINAYNAFVLKSVIDAYPVKSVREIKWFYGFFYRIDHVAGGQSYTLTHIEHQIIRKRFDEPRVHAALNCASIGFPRLPQKAFLPQTLEQDLESAMRFFVREDRNVLLEPEKNRIFLSKILDEFEDDFTGWYGRKFKVKRPTIRDYLSLYLPVEDGGFFIQHPDVRIRYLPYDWQLNDQAQQ